MKNGRKTLSLGKYVEMANNLVGTKDPTPVVEAVSTEDIYKGLTQAGASKCDLCGYWFWVDESPLSDVCEDCSADECDE